MTTPQPIEQALILFDSLVDQLEAIVAMSDAHLSA
jgi:hypothetical protein